MRALAVPGRTAHGPALGAILTGTRKLQPGRVNEFPRRGWRRTRWPFLRLPSAACVGAHGAPPLPDSGAPAELNPGAFHPHRRRSSPVPRDAQTNTGSFRFRATIPRGVGPRASYATGSVWAPLYELSGPASPLAPWLVQRASYGPTHHRQATCRASRRLVGMMLSTAPSLALAGRGALGRACGANPRRPSNLAACIKWRWGRAKYFYRVPREGVSRFSPTAGALGARGFAVGGDVSRGPLK